MSLIKSLQFGETIDAGQDEVIVRLANGRVIQISPDFNSINVWEAGAFDEAERPYCVDGKFVSHHVDMGGSTT